MGAEHLSFSLRSAAVRQTSGGSFAAPLKVVEEGAAALSEMTVMCER